MWPVMSCYVYYQFNNFVPHKGCNIPLQRQGVQGGSCESSVFPWKDGPPPADSRLAK